MTVVPPNIVAFLRFFKFDHLPAPLQAASAPFSHLATTIVEQSALLCDEGRDPDWAETMAGLRKLLEAKDCIVRARLPR